MKIQWSPLSSWTHEENVIGLFWLGHGRSTGYRIDRGTNLSDMVPTSSVVKVKEDCEAGSSRVHLSSVTYLHCIDLRPIRKLLTRRILFSSIFLTISCAMISFTDILPYWLVGLFCNRIIIWVKSKCVWILHSSYDSDLMYS